MNSSIYEKNIQVLKEHQGFSISINKEDYNCENFTKKLSKSGDEIFSYTFNNREYVLHSIYEPKQEAKKIIENIDFNKDNLIIVFGIGAAYHLYELKKKISEGTRVIVIETNIDFFMFSITNYDLSEIFSYNQIHLLMGTKDVINKLISMYFQQKIYNMIGNIQIISLPNYTIMFYDEIKEYIGEIKKILTSKLYSFGNSLEDTFNGFENLYKNTDKYFESNYLNDINNLYKGYPAIIVASGPSLSKNIEYLKKANNKSVIIACDASYDACIKNDVIPDAIASIERDEPTYSYYYKNKTFEEQTVLFAPNLIWPEILNKFNGKKVLCYKTDDGVNRWWERHFNDEDYFNVGQSSATLAFSYAAKMGCNPIILIGQDLAYTNEKKHSEITHVEIEGDNSDGDSDGTYVEDYSGNLIKSHVIYRMFKEWYEMMILANSTIEVIDATEGGAFIKGTKVMSLKDTIQKYCIKEKMNFVYDHIKIKNICNEDYFSLYKKINNSIMKEIEKLNHIQKITKEYFNKIIRLEKSITLRSNEKALMNAINTLKDGDKIINKLLNDKWYKTLVGYYRQIITQTIIEVKKLPNQISLDVVKKNILLQKNLIYMLNESTNLIIKKYKEMNEYIIEKIEKFDKIEPTIYLSSK